jgi:hypothetical protein
MAPPDSGRGVHGLQFLSLDAADHARPAMPDFLAAGSHRVRRLYVAFASRVNRLIAPHDLTNDQKAELVRLLREVEADPRSARAKRLRSILSKLEPAPLATLSLALAKQRRRRRTRLRD